MALNFMFKGAIIGFSIAAPVGPIGVLCIRRSLADGRQIGLATGLGAATADAIYGCIAGFGLTAISRFLVGQRVWLGILGGLFLCYLGIRTFISKPAEQTAEVRSGGLLSAYVTTFVLTLTNPMTVLSFIAVFAGLGLGVSPDYFSASTLVAGVFIGSALWWLLLSSGVALFRSVVGSDWMRFVNRLSGSIILAFGVYSLLASFIQMSHEMPPNKDAPRNGGPAVPVGGSEVPDGRHR
jgi:threonine/homoserine/homoserine lactone efflux protein